MKKHYKAVTFEVCEHQGLFTDMNEHRLHSLDDLYEKIKSIADYEIAPIVRVYASDSEDFAKTKMIKEFKFMEHDCGCADRLK